VLYYTHGHALQLPNTEGLWAMQIKEKTVNDRNLSMQGGFYGPMQPDF
jgi:hypothetical protein